MTRSAITARRLLPAWAPLVPWLLLVGCASQDLGAEPETVPLRIDITALPASAHTLEPTIALKRQGTWRMGDGLGPLDLSQFPKRDSIMLDLVLPYEAAAADVAVAVRAQDQDKRLVALGSTVREAFDQPRKALAVLEVRDDRSVTPMLVKAQPEVLKRSVGSGLFLYGWGFHPEAKVLIDGQEQAVTWRSSAQLGLSLPADTLKGTSVVITVTNPDQTTDTRSDLVVVGD